MKLGAEMGYRERLLWAYFLPLFLVGLYYFAAWQWSWRTGHVPSVGRLMLVLSAGQIAGAALVKYFSRREPTDERDRWIELRAFRLGYWCLWVGTVLWVCYEFKGRDPSPAFVPEGVVLLGILFGVELIRLGSMLSEYRSGPRA